MKKRILSLLLVLLMVVTLVPTAALAEDDVVAYEVTGGNIYFNKSTGEITGCDFDVTEANIPSEIDGVKVTGIADWAFIACCNSLTSIGLAAFADCTNLTSVIISDGVTSIYEIAFAGCTSLADIYYTGNEAQWNAIEIADGNEVLLNATIHYNYHEHVTELCNAIKPTCTEDGYTGDEVCSVCGEIVSQGETIDATGHHYKGSTCTVCGDTRSTADTIRAWFQDTISTVKNFHNIISEQ